MSRGSAACDACRAHEDRDCGRDDASAAFEALKRTATRLEGHSLIVGSTRPRLEQTNIASDARNQPATNEEPRPRARRQLTSSARKGHPRHPTRRCHRRPSTDDPAVPIPAASNRGPGERTRWESQPGPPPEPWVAGRARSRQRRGAHRRSRRVSQKAAARTRSGEPSFLRPPPNGRQPIDMSGAYATSRQISVRAVQELGPAQSQSPFKN